MIYKNNIIYLEDNCMKKIIKYRIRNSYFIDWKRLISSIKIKLCIVKIKKIIYLNRIINLNIKIKKLKDNYYNIIKITQKYVIKKQHNINKRIFNYKH